MPAGGTELSESPGVNVAPDPVQRRADRRAEQKVARRSRQRWAIAAGVSVNLVRCIELAREVGAAVFGIVGRDGGYTKEVADACVVIPVVDPELVTPHTEGLQAVVWHLLVSHPKLKSAPTKWESVVAVAR